MDDVISLSSGNEEDSDVEFIGSYRDGDCNGIPFIKAELLPVTPVLIDITERHFSPNKPKPRTIEVIDLNSVSESRVRHQAKSRNTIKLSPYTLNLEEDVICLDPGDGNGGQSPVQLSYDPENDLIQACLEASRAVEDSQLSTTKNITLSHEPSDGLLEFFEAQNTNHTQQTSPSPLVKKNADHGSLDSSHSWLNEEVSPLNLSDSYNCPSEIDVAVFSDESLFLYDDDEKRKRTSGYIQAESSSFEIGESLAAQENPPAHALPPHPQTQTNFQPAFQMLPTSDQALLAASPTSTELLAGDSPETGSDLDIESPPISPVKSSYTPSPLPHMPLDIKDSGSVLQDDNTGADADTDTSGLSEQRTEEAQQISLVQFKKLKYLLGAQDRELHAADEDGKEFGMAEPLSRQSLSLVYSTIDENYTDGTLQLLSDLIQPCYYPPAHITSHLLKEVLLEPHCSRELSLEAYNLLMRTQKYHPADKFTIAWDWELLSSVMAEQDKARRLHGEVRCLLLQYVLQVLEDDFHFKLPMLRLHLTIASEMLSCDHSFRQVRELVTWLLDEAKQSFCTSEDEGMQKRERNCCLKMLLILQRMLLLAMEVDLRPTCSSSKLSQELCNSLNCMAPCRRLRFLLLSTLQSNLLRCKMVELLLDQSCSQKRVLPMSFKLLLHFLQTSTPTPDPSDGTERWRRWDEILQLVWMLMISYQEVITGHLRYSITERFKLSRPPMWTQNDQVTRAAVQEAAEAFLSRAVKDLGHDLPIQVQESLSQLQEHLLSISLQ